MTTPINKLLPRKEWRDKSGIYCFIEEKTNRLLYIGKATCLYSRQRRHKHDISNHIEPRRLQAIVDKIGQDKVLYKVLKQVKPKDLVKVEKKFIEMYNPTGNTQLAIHSK